MTLRVICIMKTSMKHDDKIKKRMQSRGVLPHKGVSVCSVAVCTNPSNCDTAVMG